MADTAATGGLADGLQALLPRLVLYTVVGVWTAWVYHLMKPALVAALSSEYSSFNWVSGKKTVGSFLHSTWRVAFKSRQIFADIHRKVRSLVFPAVLRFH